MKPSKLLKLVFPDILLTQISISDCLTCEKYFLKRRRTSQTVEQITKGFMGKQKQIGLGNYLKFDSVKLLTQLLPTRTLKMQKSTQISPSTLTTAFTNESMKKRKQIGLKRSP